MANNWDEVNAARHLTNSTASSRRSPGVSMSELQLHDDDGPGLPAERQDETLAGRPEYLTGFALWVSMVSLMLSIFLIAMDLTIVATAVPAITNEFNSITDQAWYASAFFLTAGGFQSTWGKIYQSFPLKMSFFTAVFIFEVGSLICAVAPSSPAFIAGRVIAGFGSSGVGSGSYTIVAYISEPKRRANHTAFLGAIFGIGSVLGPLVGGAFSTSLTWRWCFYINLPIGVPPVLGIIFFLRLPSIAKPQKTPLRERLLRLDPIGSIFLLGGIVTYLLAVQMGGVTRPWNSGTVIALLVVCFVACTLFGLVEWWQDERATVVPRLFGNRFVGMSMVYICFQGGALFSMVYYLPLYFQAILGDSAVLAGAHNLAFIIPAMAAVLVSGVIVTNTGLATLTMVVGSAIGTLGCGLCYLFDINTTTGVWVGVQIVAGVGLGFGFQVPLMAAQASVKPADLPAATAMLMEFQTLGGAIWVSATQAIFLNRVLINLPKMAPTVNPEQLLAIGAGDLRKVFESDELMGVLDAYSDGIQSAFLLICAVTGVSIMAGLVIPLRRIDTARIDA
ncbi:MFS transporter, DHA2 family, glioxin efflux transporter [Geosmithia morbida]|uniref:MFS transporter, DHA2 family, glioxin efflux transporter n=1 Tax=Geosmithia morbida TaxID=1094350 RepID=A0A9P5D315_9HYPO|nr:MFS transporter, DHA2 family, glioxin efflux transporter [Geosmithia morbida]KAF4125703.1 MFS transporter, DHA2 family, glioxin efflux transporter [Geosmithia morbida]